jgi:NitT/TauT family transport system substrate-binding protein
MKLKCFFFSLLVILFSSEMIIAAPLRLGLLPVLNTLPLQVAAHEKIFERHGLDVELVPFSSAMEREMAMQTGALDGFFGDFLNVLLLAQNKVPIKMLTLADPDKQYPIFGLALCPDSEHQPSAQGKTLEVGMSKATVIDLIMDRMQTLPEFAHTTLKPLEVRKLPIRFQMLVSGKIDAAILPEPLLSLARLKGCPIVVTDTQLDLPMTVIAIHEDRSDTFDEFKAAYAEAVKRINAHPEDYRDLMSSTCRVPKPLQADFPVFTYPPTLDLPSESELVSIQQWMLSQGLLNTLIPYSTLVP